MPGPATGTARRCAQPPRRRHQAPPRASLVEFPAVEQVARALGVRLPITAERIVRYTMGRPLDFNPGSASVYSNFDYCVLDCVIEAVSGEHYGEYIKRHILTPLGVAHMRLGRNLLRDRAPDEVKYYDGKHETGRAISRLYIDRQVPMPTESNASRPRTPTVAG
jgi:CubicO group peptidase (beta-lactamase class C family)